MGEFEEQKYAEKKRRLVATAIAIIEDKITFLDGVRQLYQRMIDLDISRDDDLFLSIIGLASELDTIPPKSQRHLYAPELLERLDLSLKNYELAQHGNLKEDCAEIIQRFSEHTGALFHFIAVGTSIESGNWCQLLDLTYRLVQRTLGPMGDAHLDYKDEEGNEWYQTVNVEESRNAKGFRRVATYPISGGGAIVYDIHEESLAEESLERGEKWWEFAVCVPVSPSVRVDAMKNSIDLWNLTGEGNDDIRFIACGEELEVWKETPSVIRGQLNPIDIPLCEMAIASNRFDFPQANLGTRVEMLNLAAAQLFVRDNS